MAFIKFYKVLSLPSVLHADSLYFVSNGNYAEAYVTDGNGNAKMLGNSTMINQLIAASGGGGGSGLGDMLKAIYDADEDGKVDIAENAEMLASVPANQYLLKSESKTINGGYF